jgi:uroporphyrinogen-III decarboxylase
MIWRNFDLTNRCEKLTKTFNLEEVKTPEDVPVIIHTPCYFEFGNNPRQTDYYSNPASMVKFQEDGYLKHLSLVDDDTVPYFMPWFGTGILAASFGCKYSLNFGGPGSDPAVISKVINSPADVAKIKIPDPCTDKWMSLVLKFIDYARENSDLPIGLTDMNSPLSMLDQLCGTKVYTWIYEEPNAVKDLMEILTETIINWVKVQKEHIGEPLNASNGLQGVWSPKYGIWLSDDNLVMLGPEHYEEFVIPYYSRIFETFGGGNIHFCGNGAHLGESLLKIKNIRAVNNSPLGDFDAFEKLYKMISGKVTLQLQDNAPILMDEYYDKLFERITSFVLDNVGMTSNGGYENVQWNTFETANKVTRAFRNAAEKVILKNKHRFSHP